MASMIAPRLAMLSAAALLAAAPLAAQAQDKAGLMYRCTGKDGKRYYQQTIPPACYGQKMEIINAQGNVVKRIDPEAEERLKAEKAAGITKKAEQTPAEREAERRKRALLATYNSEKDIEDARTRALNENQKQVNQVEAKINEIKTRRTRYEKELAVYMEKAKGDKNASPPPVLKENISNANMDIKAQEGTLELKKKEAEQINAKYDEDKKYFREYTAR
jgi:hypothetical protein